MMGDPRRWRDDPESRSDAADLLLRGTRRPQGPQPDELARLGAAVDALARRPTFAARRRPWFAIAAAAALTLAALGTGAWAWRASVERAALTALAVDGAPAADARPLAALGKPRARVEPGSSAGGDDAAPVVTPPPAAERKIDRRPAHRAPRREQPARPAEPAATETDTLVRETALVDAARRDLAGAPAAALDLLAAHRREFPRGQLAAEREFLAVEALRRLGRLPEARRRAAALTADHPTSSYAARAARLLEAP